MVGNTSRTLKLPDSNEINILIVDDDPIVLDVISSFVASYNYKYATASDGLEAVEELKKQEFSIIITDINMPNMDGMELLTHARQYYPDTGVIVVTGLSEEYTYVDVISSGAIDYMTKPFDGDELLARLHRVLREQTLVKQLEQMSISDSLTGLNNRRHFDMKIAEELHRAVRQKYRIFLALIDVDKFKEYNDSYGHQAGDTLLATIGEVLRSCARRGVDYVFRYGGDEFALIITQTTLEQALKISERIRKGYKEYNFDDTSLSFGLAEFVREPDYEWTEDIQRFIKIADQALYEAKNTGRDKIVSV